MATNVQNTQEALTVVQRATPYLLDTQEFLVVVVRGSIFNFTPTIFNLQKLVLTVKESNIPARGRNQ